MKKPLVPFHWIEPLFDETWPPAANFAVLLNATDLHIGERARIVRLQDGPYTRRLFEMGCVPGTTISLEFTSPSGDPMAFNIDGYTLGLRKSEACVIEVEPSGYEP